VIDAHCGSGDCRCNHADPCYKGWIDGLELTIVKPSNKTDGIGTVTKYPAVGFCPNCRPEQSFIMKSFPRDQALAKLKERGGLGRFSGKTEVL